jgi:AcrR family transcriptional regulator
MPGTKAPEAERKEQILTAAFDVAAQEGLDGMTIMRVGRVAGLSPGLVMFHFKSKRALVLAVLDHLLASTTVLRVPAAIEAIASPAGRWIALLESEMQRISSEPLRVRLTFDYWAAGIRDKEVGDRLRAEFARYRKAFVPLAASVIASMPDRFAGATAKGLADVGVSMIKGCAVQAMIAPGQFDIDAYLVAVEALLWRMDPSAARRGRAS